MEKIFLLTAIILLCVSCDKPCPRSIKIGEVFFSEPTMVLLPENEPTRSLIFENEAGENLVFSNQNQVWQNVFQIDVETICEEGEFPGKNIQTHYFSAPVFQAIYKTADQEYSLNLQFVMRNVGVYGNKNDTILYEEFSVWGQKYGSDPFIGGFTLLTDTRGNDLKIPDEIQNNQNWRFLGDTILNNKPLYSLYTNVVTQTRNLYIFYRVQNGLEAFTLTNGEVWTRK